VVALLTQPRFVALFWDGDVALVIAAFYLPEDGANRVACAKALGEDL